MHAQGVYTLFGFGNGILAKTFGARLKWARRNFWKTSLRASRFQSGFKAAREAAQVKCHTKFYVERSSDVSLSEARVAVPGHTRSFFTCARLKSRASAMHWRASTARHSLSTSVHKVTTSCNLCQLVPCVLRCTSSWMPFCWGCRRWRQSGQLGTVRQKGKRNEIENMLLFPRDSRRSLNIPQLL